MKKIIFIQTVIFILALSFSATYGADKSRLNFHGIKIGMTDKEVSAILGKLNLFTVRADFNILKSYIQRGDININGYKIYHLEFTSGKRLCRLEATKEFAVEPNWKVIKKKMVKKYGSPKIKTSDEAPGHWATDTFAWGSNCRTDNSGSSGAGIRCSKECIKVIFWYISKYGEKDRLEIHMENIDMYNNNFRKAKRKVEKEKHRRSKSESESVKF